MNTNSESDPVLNTVHVLTYLIQIKIVMMSILTMKKLRIQLSKIPKVT